MNYLSELASGRFMTLPAPLQIGLGVIAGTGTLGGTWLLVGNSPSRNTAMIIVAIGLVCVFLLFVLFRALVKWNAKRKASPLAQGIAGNAAAAPQGVSEPARRARLDDLRRNFEQGVEKFRAAGKNLYSVPWYVLVGEPGSGKTEAIRHCNVGFPPGLQDQLQGAGGTLNMNWWFTNSAIILDTAGRLMFEEVPPGSTNEWHEFLKLLRQNRPNSPLNGMLLVIPVDTLIKDSADAIEKKATKIAQQFDQIQRTLGVRFPVFVIISKCDLLNGFREFFDDLNDPQLQHQIMGWSNPAPLDERFDPAKVTAHLESVKQRLIARRQNLLLDPVHSEDPQARRVDQVDALYTLPDSVTKIGPRLRRYLEMIFVAGEWSPKPLFLRGIYFTSSMTEGAALDAELAEALGVPVDSLPGGAIFRKDRAYFLRDLFLEKVFREKGLVTRASNADKQQRTRRMLILGFGFLAVLVLFIVTWLGSRSLEKSLGAERAFWDTAAGWDFGKIAIIRADRNNAYFGDPSMTVAGSATSLPDLFASRLDKMKTDLAIPFIFKPMTVLSSDVNGKRRVAYRSLFESTVLRPVYGTVRSKIPGDTWDTKRGPAALAQLMKLEFAAATGKPPVAADSAHPQMELVPLFALALSDEDYQKYTKDNEGLQKVADWIYGVQAKDDAAWPHMLGAGTPANLDAVKAGVDATVAYWQAQTTDNGKALESIKAVREALVAFRDAEAALNVASKGGAIDKLEVYHAYRDVWKTQMDKLRDAGKRAADAWALAAGKADAESLRKLYEDQKTRMVGDAQNAYDLLLKFTPPVEGARDNDSYRALLAARTKLDDAKKALLAWNTTPENKKTLDDLAALDAAYFGRTIKGLDKADHHRFEVHQQLYELADKMVIKDDASVTLTGTLAEAFSQTDKEYSDAVNTLKQPLLSAGGEQLNQAGALAQFTIDASGRAKKFLLADGVLAGFPKDAAGWNAAVTKFAKDAPRDALMRPQVPLAAFPAGLDKTFTDQFSPDAAGVVVDRLDAINKLASDKDAAAKILDSSDLKSRADAASKTFGVYKEAYVRYWRDTVKDELNFSESYTDFKAFSAKIADATEASAYEQLRAYGERMVYALARIGDADDANAVKLALPAISREECKIALSGWTNLGADPVQVRNAILGKIANDFREGYTVPSAKNNDGYAARYWNSLPVAGLRALVADGQKQIRDGIAELARYERFPLAPIGDPKDDLTQADILAARKALEKIRGAGTAASAAAPGVAAAASAKPISQGGVINSKAVDDQLDLLRGTNLLSGKQEYFDKLDKFFAGLPPDNKPFVLILTVNKAKLAAVPDSISNAYSYMPISQANKPLCESNLISTSTTDTAAVEYAGGDLAFAFRQTLGGQTLQTETFPGPWAALRLLKSPNVKSVSREGNKWTVEYTVTTPAKKAVALWLTLEFKQPIPDLKDWPAPPGKPN